MSWQGFDIGHWSGGLAEWTDEDTAYLSVAFTWRLNDAYQRACWYKAVDKSTPASLPHNAPVEVL